MYLILVHNTQKYVINQELPRIYSHVLTYMHINTQHFHDVLDKVQSKYDKPEVADIHFF
jgi:hypothetical protein